MTEPAGFNELIRSATEINLFSGILPFVISYILIFLALSRMPLLNEMDDGKAKKINALLSIALSLNVSYFLVMNPTYQAFFSQFFGRIIIAVIGVIGLMVLIATLGLSLDKMKAPVLIGLLVVFGVSAFSLSGGLQAFLPEPIEFESDGVMAFFEYMIESGLIWVVLVAAALYWVTTESGDSDYSSKAKWWFTPPKSDPS